MRKIYFDNGFSCTEEFYFSVMNQILEVVPIIRKEHPDIKWIIKILCGKDFWSELLDGEPNLAGMCAARQAELGEIPFENVPRQGKSPYPLQYKFKEEDE